MADWAVTGVGEGAIIIVGIADMARLAGATAEVAGATHEPSEGG